MVDASTLLLARPSHRHGAIRAPLASQKGRRSSGAAWNRARLRSRRIHSPLFTSMTQAWQDWRSTSTMLIHFLNSSRTRGASSRPSPLIVDEFGGQYEENFADVDKHLLDYFTYKAVKTVLAQLHEMNPTEYSWFHNFVVDNKPQDSKYFLRTLVKEKQELGERVMVTRLHLFNKWVKRYNHMNVHTSISDQNLELLRERLAETIKWPSDADDNQEP